MSDSIWGKEFGMFGDTIDIDTGGFVVRNKLNRIEFWNDTLWFKGFHGTLEYAISTDTGKIYAKTNAALTLSHSKAIDICVPHETIAYEFSYAGLRPLVDTMYFIGMSNFRWSDVFTLRNWIISPEGEDTTKQYMSADTMYHESENPNKFDNDVFVDGSIKIGENGSIVDSVKVVGSNLEFYVNGTAYQASVKP